MVLTTLLLFCCTAIPNDTPRNSAAQPAAEAASSPTLPATKESESVKPDAPTPKAAMAAAPRTDLDLASGGEAGLPAIEPAALSTPVKPATAESYETSRQRGFWYGLMAVSHGAAAFDAWTTRRAVGGGYGIEGDPVQRPFAHSGAIYATTQVTPVIMDYLGHRMMRSSHPWMRKAWWVPQAASASVSLGAGIHNYYVVP